MRSTLIVLFATVGGIVLAWLLFAPSPATTTASTTPKPTAAATTPPPTPPRPAEPPASLEEHANVNAGFQARINEPDAKLAGQQASNWTVIRRELASNPDPAAQALMGEVSDLVRDLREARLRPDSADMKTLETRQADLRARIEGSGFKTPVLAEQIKRLDETQGPSAAELANRPGGVSGPPPESPGPEPTSVPPFAPHQNPAGQPTASQQGAE